MTTMPVTSLTSVLRRGGYRLSVLLLGLVCVAGMSQAAPPAEAPSEITVQPQDGFNLVVTEHLTSGHVLVAIDPPVHNWFAGTFTQLPLDTPVTLGLSLAGAATPGNVAAAAKWRGLRPVMTEADPTHYATYVWYSKDATGRWRSGDPFAAAADAGTGPVPVQAVIPADRAAQYLADDGRTWAPWREIDEVTVLPHVNIVRMRQTFATPTATVAMRVPFTYTYLEHVLARLEAAALPGVTVETLGTTTEGRRLQVIRLEAPADAPPLPGPRPTVLVYAGEHATEHDAGWGALGMLHWLLSDAPAAQQARAQSDWLLIPMLTPDDAAHARFRIGDDYRPQESPTPEVRAYATWLVERVNAGGRLDLVVNLHNVECTEGPHLFSPCVNPARTETVEALHGALFARAQAAGFTVGTPQGWGQAVMGLRLSGWCFRRFHTLDLAFELNTRTPEARLSLARTLALGETLAAGLAAFVTGDAMAPLMAEIDTRRAARAVAQEAHWARTGRTPATRTLLDVIWHGY